eukprot:COSAG02_NODE_5100_length_4629_cov_87.536424_4_plen_363_part_00
MNRTEQFVIKDGAMWTPASSAADPECDRTSPPAVDGVVKLTADTIDADNDTVPTNIHQVPPTPDQHPVSQLHRGAFQQLERTQKDEEKSDWRQHSPLSEVRSWRFTPSPLQEEQFPHQSQRPSTHGSTPLVVATPHMIAQLQRQMDDEADAQWHAAVTVSPVPMRAVRSRAAPAVSPDNSYQARRRSRGLQSSKPSRAHTSTLSASKAQSSQRDDSTNDSSQNSARRNNGVEGADNIRSDGLLLSAEHDSNKRPRHRQPRQHQQTSKLDVSDPRKQPHQPHSSYTVWRQGVRESEADLLEDVRQKWQFAHLRPSPHRSSRPQANTQRRRAQRPTDAMDETAAVDETPQQGSRHWSEAPRWRP